MTEDTVSARIRHWATLLGRPLPALATTIMTVAAAVTIAMAFGMFSDTTPNDPPNAAAEAASSPPLEASFHEGSAQCVAMSGDAAPCTATHAGALVDLTDCSPTAAMNAWGLDPQLDSLSLTTVVLARQCAVFPGDVAVKGGASGNDVLASMAGHVPSALRECARSAGTDVPCSQAHEIEFVGDWKRIPPIDDTHDICRSTAARYTATALTPTSELRSETAKTNGELYRCAVRVDHDSLSGSVRDIGGDPLPR